MMIMYIRTTKYIQSVKYACKRVNRKLVEAILQSLS